ncbi:MAG: fumarylacetoacetate hydrolase family protein [Planctomycetota bacterium]|nr:fumarylacetoacetate hydrolase family protein [Planctomycetota bacterium]
MQLVRFRTESTESWGVQTDEGVRDLGAILKTCPTMLDAIGQWEQLGSQVESVLRDAPLLSECQLLSPLPESGKTICIGLNYRDHAIETGADIPTEPVVFNKLAGTVCGPDEEIPLPQVSQQVDFEAELVMVIGKQAWNVVEQEAEDFIFGYMCGHDVSARDWQKGRPGGQWLLGKSFPNFAPTGPYLVPNSEISDPCNLRIQMRINGETYQDSNTSQLIFSPSQLIAHLSQCTILQPGDLIFTGTPPGVGAARNPPRFLEPGDVCEVEVQGLGVLRNPVVAAKQ